MKITRSKLEQIIKEEVENILLQERNLMLASQLGVDPDDPFANLEGGARYLREQLDRFDGDLEKALAAYNAGPGRVIRAGGVPRIRETQLYVAAIMGRLSDHSRE